MEHGVKPDSAGVIYAAYGEKAHEECRKSVLSLLRLNKLPVIVASDEEVNYAPWTKFDFDGSNPAKGRWAKVNADKLTPWDKFLFLDADTRVCRNISWGFEILDTWDIAMAASPEINQGHRLISRLGLEEQMEMLNVISPGHNALQYNSGVMFVKKNQRTRELYDAWRNEWMKYRRADQASLIRALRSHPVMIWGLTRAWNGGKIIQHRFGSCKCKGEQWQNTMN